jgi:hypothetical protein
MNVGFRMIVAGVDGKARPINPHEWMKIACDTWIKAHSADLEAQLAVLQSELLFNTIKKDLAQLLLAEKNNEEIIQFFSAKSIELTEEQLTKFVRKAISTLRTPEEPIDKIQEAINQVVNKLKDIRKDGLSYLKTKWSLLRT